MKKLAVLALVFLVVLNPSQAKTTSVERVFISHKRSVLMSQTATKNVLVHAIPRTQRRLLVADLVDDENDDPPGPDELDLQSLYRRPRIVETPHNELSDYVTVRLAVARARAMAAYREKFTKTA